MFPIDTDDINIVPIIEKRQILQTIQYTAFIINHAKELNWGVSLKHTHVHTHTHIFKCHYHANDSDLCEETRLSQETMST